MHYISYICTTFSGGAERVWLNCGEEAKKEKRREDVEKRMYKKVVSTAKKLFEKARQLIRSPKKW